MSKKKDKKNKDNTSKKEIVEIKRLGKCRKCNKPMAKNHLACGACKKKRRLQSKANRRGLPKNQYL